MLKIIGIILVCGSTISIGVLAKNEMLLRVKSLEQIVFVIEIIENELHFKILKFSDIILKLSKEINNPVGRVFKKMYKLVSVSDGISTQYKWSKTFDEYGEFLHIEKRDLEIIKSMSNVLGKYDVDEQIKSLKYYKNLVLNQLSDAKSKLVNDGKITGTIAVSVGLLIVIILI